MISKQARDTGINVTVDYINIQSYYILFQDNGQSYLRFSRNGPRKLWLQYIPDLVVEEGNDATIMAKATSSETGILNYEVISPLFSPIAFSTSRNIPFITTWSTREWDAGQYFINISVWDGVSMQSQMVRITVLCLDSNNNSICDKDENVLRIALKKGWNLFGYFLPKKVNWMNVNVTDGATIKPIAEAQSSGWLQETVYYFDASTQTYGLVSGDGYIYPSRGYWLYAAEDNLTLIIS